MSGSLEMQNPDSTLSIFDYQDFRLLLETTLPVDQHIISHRVWEQLQLDYLSDLTAENNRHEERIFIDIGSDLSLYSSHAARAGIFSKIFSFEPDHCSFEQLQGNIFLNKLERSIVARCEAVSDHTHEGHLLEGRNCPCGNRAGASLRSAPSSDTTHVECFGLDLFDFSNQSLVIKLDIKGHECEALTVMKRLLLSNLVTLQVEALEGTKICLLGLAEKLKLRHIETRHVNHYFWN